MSGNPKTVALINRKIKEGKAVVLSDRELLHEIRTAKRPGVPDVDVVAISWNAPIAGAAVMLCIQVAERGAFTRARKIWLNGVAGFPGPAPNERLGEVDTLIFAEQPSRNEQAQYCGAMLFVDMLRKKQVEVECLSEEGDTYRSALTIDRLQFARMYVYNCFFDGLPADGETGNPNACRLFASVAAGSKVLLNRAHGVVVGCGTRSTPERRSISLAADMFDMDPGVMTVPGETTAAAITNSIALAVPILSEEGLEDLCAWLQADRRREGVHLTEDNMSQYLKELVMNGKFFLT